MPVHIAVIGKNQEIKAVLMRLINQNKAFIGSAADSLEELEASGKINEVNLLLLSAGLSDEEEADIKRKIAANYPKVKVVPHYGGGSGLLMNEISEVLK